MSNKPGDIANGHILGADNRWHKIYGDPPPPRPPSAPRPPSMYWQDYRKFWGYTCLTVFPIAVILYAVVEARTAEQPAQMGAIVAGAVVSAALSTLFWGSIANLVVAWVAQGRR